MTTPATSSPFQSSFVQAVEDSRNLPEWWKAHQQKSWEIFQRLPMPTRQDENWRFASVNQLSLDEFAAASPLSQGAKLREIEESSPVLSEIAGLLIFVNDRLVSFQPVDQELAQQGVIWKPLSVALNENSDLLEKHFMSQPVELGSEKFSALHGALCRDGGFLYVPRNVAIKKPFLAYHWVSGENQAIFPHTLVIADDCAEVTLLDAFHSDQPESRQAVVGINDLYAGPGSKVNYFSTQNWSKNTLAFHLNSTQVFRDANISSLNLNLGGKIARTESHSRVLGEGAHTEMLSLTVSKDRQEFDQRTLQTHFKGHSVSDLLYKNALLDNSRTIFSGLIRVMEDAQQTDAYQTNRNLLLNPSAEANSLPGLEILANDVKCSHGATTGQIDEEQLYYLKARGIPEKVAYELLTYGFFEEVLAKITHEEIGELFRGLIRQKFQD